MINKLDVSHLDEKDQIAYKKFIEIAEKRDFPKRPYIKMNAKKLHNETLTSSKVGGTPFLKSLDDIPIDVDNQPMRLLVQINLSDLPEQQQIIPAKSGLLQFWISADEDLYGCDFGMVSSQEKNRLLYIEDLETDLTLEEIQNYFEGYEVDDGELPFKGVVGFDFELAEQTITLSTEAFSSIMNEMWQQANPDYDIQTNPMEHIELLTALAETFSRTGVFHQIGGYPFFTQADPRYDQEICEFDSLLLQIDSDSLEEDDDNAILWGDNGICNIFVRPEDLSQMKFNEYLYNWDCT